MPFNLATRTIVSTTYDFSSAVLEDRRIDDSEVARIREYLYRDGQLNLDDVKLLVELYCHTQDYSPSFEDLFFTVLEQVLLADGVVQPAEQFYLLKMVYSDHEIRDRERQFLLEMRQKARISPPEFEYLCQEALHAHPTDWDTGGR